jgi:hypothetical protein
VGGGAAETRDLHPLEGSGTFLLQSLDHPETAENPNCFWTQVFGAGFLAGKLRPIHGHD